MFQSIESGSELPGERSNTVGAGPGDDGGGVQRPHHDADPTHTFLGAKLFLTSYVLNFFIPQQHYWLTHPNKTALHGKFSYCNILTFTVFTLKSSFFIR